MAREIRTERPVEDADLFHVYRIASRLVTILGTMVLLAFVVILLLVGGFIYALFGSQVAEGYTRGEAATRIQELVLGMWDKLLPITQGVFSVVAPVLIISLALLALRLLSRYSASPFNLSKVTTDLPSTLALLIIIAICLLPLSGLSVPDVLSNIALVVVGFYFGERRRREREVEGASERYKPGGEESPYEETNPFSAEDSRPPAPKGAGESEDEVKERANRGWDNGDDSKAGK